VDNNKLVSIIVPVYNTGSYLVPCLESIMHQSYENFEVLLVDDGSTDDSPEVCNRYADLDVRFRVFHQENGGVSKARNVGLHQSRGEFITFVDADDKINNYYLEQLMRPLLVNDAIDVAVGSIVRVTSAGKNKVANSYQDDKIYEGHEILRMLLDAFQGNWYVWSKIYRADLFEDVYFDETLKTGEDFDVVWKIFKKAEQVVYVRESEYYYMQRENSITTNVPFAENVKHFRNFCTAMYSATAQEDEILYSSMKHKFCFYFWDNIKKEVRREGKDYKLLKTYFVEFRPIMLDVLSAIPIEMIRNAIYGEFVGSFEDFVSQREEMYESLKTPGRRYIYGAGKIAKKAANNLIKRGIEFAAFVVSDGECISNSHILGHEIIHLEEVTDSRVSVVVMALGTRNLIEVMPSVENRHFKKIYFW